MILPLSLYVKGEMEVLDIKTKHIAQYVRMWYVLWNKSTEGRRWYLIHWEAVSKGEPRLGLKDSAPAPAPIHLQWLPSASRIVEGF
jgi:hypothetical protein